MNQPTCVVDWEVRHFHHISSGSLMLFCNGFPLDQERVIHANVELGVAPGAQRPEVDPALMDPATAVAKSRKSGARDAFPGESARAGGGPQRLMVPGPDWK